MSGRKQSIRVGACLLAVSLFSGLLPATPSAPARLDKSILNSKTVFMPKPLSANWNPDAKVVTPKAPTQEAMSYVTCGVMVGLFGPLVWFAIKNDCSL